MITFIVAVHIIVSLGLILVVLIQTGRGAEMGAVFGGSSSTIFGSSGAGNFLTRLTTAMAIVFMLTSLTLGYFTGKAPTSSIFDSISPPAGQQAPPTTTQEKADTPAASAPQPVKTEPPGP